MSINTPAWVKDAIFYQIFPDRFASSKRVSKKGLSLESWDSPPTFHGFKGGDLLGIVDHLDYLQDLGINALYLNPITASASNHRYHTYDYFHIDPLLGGDAAFRELLDAAHARGIRIVPDGVFNHASRGFWQFHHVLENGAGSPYVNWFHFDPDRLRGQKRWGAYPGEQEQDQLRHGASSFEALGYQAWWNLPALPKLNTDTPEVREFIFDAAVHWIKFGADGWRLDVPAEINDDAFWQEFRKRVKRVNPEAYIVGEIWHESQRWLQGDQFDATMNYLVTSALIGWLIGDKVPEYILTIGEYRKSLRTLDAPAFADRIDALLALYDPAINFAQLNLLDSHDTPRFLTTAVNDASALRLGWLFLFTYVGAPCVYYGDEIGLDGGLDPACRKAFPWNEDEWDHDLRDTVKTLAALRKSQPALRGGSFQRLFAEGDVFSYMRRLGSDRLVVVFNTSRSTKNIEFGMSTLGVKDGPAVTLYGNGKTKVVDGQLRGLKLAPRTGVILKV